jgi:hypothetical protein
MGFYQLGRILREFLNLTSSCDSGQDCSEVCAKVDLSEAVDNDASTLGRTLGFRGDDDGVKELSVKKVSGVT